ncbi:hypothetical protein Efla_002608 [Eimeria flavescens]
MEAATAEGLASAWGPPTDLPSFLLQAFACPAPFSPNYVPPGIRSRFVSAGFPLRPPPLGAPEGVPVKGFLGALGELMANCIRATTDSQYEAILTFGSYDKFQKPNLPELLACIALIALGPLTSQQLQIFIESRLGGVGGSRVLAASASSLFFFLRVAALIFVPLSLFCFAVMYVSISGVSTALLVAAALAVGFLLSLPALSPEALSPLVGAFLLPCYAFSFSTRINSILAAQLLFCLFTAVTCRGARGTVSLRRLLSELLLVCVRRYLVPFADHRGMQMIVTCVAILGVDFLTFPRRFCKSVNSGVTLMDLGVGGIIFTSGMVSPHAKGRQQPPEHQKSLLAAVRRAAAQSSVLGLFGLLRFLVMSLTNLHVSPSEYGLHWNFYLTLMVVFVGTRLQAVGSFCLFSSPYLLNAFFSICYQAIISYFDLDEWMMEGPRTNFFSANREGIMGSVGFLCLFLLAVAVGHFFVLHAPSKEDEEIKQERRSCACMRACCSLSFSFLAAGLLLQEGLGLLPRRRFVNLSWVIFVGGIEVFAVAAATAADSLAARLYPQWALRGTNENQLIIFLVANFCVGLVNMTLRTLLQPAVVAWGVLTVYMFLLFVCAHYLGLSGRRIKIL